MELLVPEHLAFGHNSPLANGAVGDGKRVFTLALPRSERKPEVTEKSEQTARFAAARLCQKEGLRIEKVWFEDGMHDDFGMYRRWYMIMEKAA
jgi:hypothetical protein